MSRFEKALTALLMFLLLAAAGLAAFLLLGDRRDRAAVTADTIGVPGVTESGARPAYERAQPVALDWAADARLLSLRGNWRVGSTFPPDGASWAVVFYSPERSATALIAVTDGQANLIGSSVSERRPALADLSMWETDSGTILERFLESGGQSFVDAHGEVSLILSLDTSDRFRWRAALLAPETGEIFVMEFDPTTGVAIQ